MAYAGSTARMTILVFLELKLQIPKHLGQKRTPLFHGLSTLFGRQGKRIRRP